jgi:ATP-dependent Clp protease ATP-binding subunit ClpC
MAVKAAIDEARTAGNAFVGTEHMLLGILDIPGNLGVTVIEGAGVTPPRLREEVTGRLLPPEADPPAGTRGGRGRGRRGPDGRPRRRIPFTPQARRVFDVAVGEALALGHNYLGCEHLLLAVAVTDGIAADSLTAVGLDVDRLRQGVIDATDAIEQARRPQGDGGA